MFIVICLYLAWVGLNTLFSGIIIRGISHPKYSIPINIMGDCNYSVLILFVGLPLLFFYKKLRKKRIKEYYEYVISNNHLWDYGLIMGVETSPEEIKKLNRLIKLDEINRKIKRKKSLW